MPVVSPMLKRFTVFVTLVGLNVILSLLIFRDRLPTPAYIYTVRSLELPLPTKDVIFPALPTKDVIFPALPTKDVIFPALPTKDVIVRSVYLDNRPRNGHKSACVFMVEILRTALAKKSVVGCQVGSSKTTNLSIRPLCNLDWVHQTHPECTYDMAMIDCFDLKADNGSRAYTSSTKKMTLVLLLLNRNDRYLFLLHVCHQGMVALLQ